MQKTIEPIISAMAFDPALHFLEEDIKGILCVGPFVIVFLMCSHRAAMMFTILLKEYS